MTQCDHNTKFENSDLVKRVRTSSLVHPDDMYIWPIFTYSLAWNTIRSTEKALSHHVGGDHPQLLPTRRHPFAHSVGCPATGPNTELHRALQREVICDFLTVYANVNVVTSPPHTDGK